MYLNSSANLAELNEFGWFETNSAGNVIGTKHVLFHGSGVPPGIAVPDAVGATVSFMPTQYFGYYYSDVSEGGCHTCTLFNFNDPDCIGYGEGDHDFEVFSTNPGSRFGTYWIAGEDPADCPNNDGDCNLTLVKIRGALNN